MPKDTRFASEEATRVLLRSLQNDGVPGKAWRVVCSLWSGCECEAWALKPQGLTAHSLTRRLAVAGLLVEEKAAEEFLQAPKPHVRLSECEALSDLGLLDGEQARRRHELDSFKSIRYNLEPL